MPPVNSAGFASRGSSSAGFASRDSSSAISTRSKSAREAAPKGVEKKVATQPVKAIKEKVVAAKEKALAKKAAKKASHEERVANPGDTPVVQKEKAMREERREKFVQ